MSSILTSDWLQSSLESNTELTSLDPRDKYKSIKFTSQPQLNGNLDSDYNPAPSMRPAPNPTSYSEALTPLSLKTSIPFPRQQPPPVPGPKPPDRRPSIGLTRQENVRSYDSGSGYPDLARHPLSYSVAPPIPPPKASVTMAR